MNLGILAALLSTISGNTSSLISKKIASPFGNRLSALFTVGFGTVPMLVGILIFGFVSLPPNDELISLAAGFFLSLGFLLKYLSLSTEQVTNIGAVAQVQPALLVIFGIFLFNEQVNSLTIISMLIVFIGAGFITITKDFKINKNLVPAILSSASWGIYWILITISVGNTGNFLASLFFSRISGVVLLLIFFSRMKGHVTEKAMQYKKINGEEALTVIALLGLATGLFNGIGDTLFGVVAKYNEVAVGSVIGIAGLVFLATAAYFLYKERLTKLQLAGFVVVLIGTLGLALS